MAAVDLVNIVKSFGETPVLKGVDLKVRDGEFVVFVGPSGCGKSTLLRVVAGLETADSGEVRIGGQAVDDRSPAERGVAMVFQSYALYPHLSVYENMAFALRLAKRPQAEIDEKVRRAAEILSIGQLLDRKPRALSGGQRQRVAIGRAIVRQPEVFLFDEPLSNLDAALRVRMRYEFARLHEQLGATMIYVTHDQVEAMTLADRIVVLNGGRIEQVGAPMELYQRPANRFVAGFIGSPRMNVLEGELIAADAGGAQVRLASGAVIRAAADASAHAVGTRLAVGIRPEALDVALDENRLTGRVRFVENLGGAVVAYLEVEGAEEDLIAQLNPETSARAGEVMSLGAPVGGVHLFAPDGAALPRLG